MWWCLFPVQTSPVGLHHLFHRHLATSQWAEPGQGCCTWGPVLGGAEKDVTVSSHRQTDKVVQDKKKIVKIFGKMQEIDEFYLWGKNRKTAKWVIVLFKQGFTSNVPEQCRRICVTFKFMSMKSNLVLSNTTAAQEKKWGFATDDVSSHIQLQQHSPHASLH